MTDEERSLDRENAWKHPWCSDTGGLHRPTTYSDGVLMWLWIGIGKNNQEQRGVINVLKCRICGTLYVPKRKDPNE